MDNLLFITINTEGSRKEELSPAQTKVLNKYYLVEGSDPDKVLNDSSHHPELSKLVSISLGYKSPKEGDIRLTTISGTESDILNNFAGISEAFKESGFHLAGHMINRFDKPYLIKKYIINGIKVPEILKDYQNKPWDQQDIDTLNMYSSGMSYSIPLESLGLTLGLIDEFITEESIKDSGEQRIKLAMKLYNHLKELI